MMSDILNMLQFFIIVYLSVRDRCLYINWSVLRVPEIKVRPGNEMIFKT